MWSRISLRTVQKNYPVFDKESMRQMFKAELRMAQDSYMQDGTAPPGKNPYYEQSKRWAVGPGSGLWAQAVFLLVAIDRLF